jgi:ubiquinone/menaquinone biosynthesis C-methylase UbiE
LDDKLLDLENLRIGQVVESLQKKDIHEGWENAYRTPENKKFYELAFDFIIHAIIPPENSLFLDAGCGNCSHSIHLAKRGFRIQAVDFSENVLEMAEENVKEKGFAERIKIKREDLTSLSFGNETFNYILCWGVLMHIPDVEKAIGELARVLKPGGY